MARRTHVTVFDDLDQTEGASAVSFAYEGKQYEVDLSDKNKAKLERALKPYLEAGRRVGGRTVARSSSGTGRNDLQEVRSWAAANGHEVAARGRVSADLLSAYDAVH